jgi:hypothetical protein
VVLVGSRPGPPVKPDPDDYDKPVRPTIVEAGVVGIVLVTIVVTIFATPFVIARWINKPFE